MILLLKLPCQGGLNDNKSIICCESIFFVENTKTESRDPMQEPIAHQCREGLGPNILIDIIINLIQM